MSYPELLPPEAHNLSPKNPPADRQGIVDKIRAYLEPALAQNATALIDEAIEAAANGT